MQSIKCSSGNILGGLERWEMYITYEQKQLSELKRLIIGTRKDLGLSQKDIADRLGIARNTYADKEKNITKMDHCMVLEVLHILGKDISICDKDLKK